MFGECCFQTGDVKLTMGTGTFLDINTGSRPQQSMGGEAAGRPARPPGKGQPRRL